MCGISWETAGNANKLNTESASARKYLYGLLLMCLLFVGPVGGSVQMDLGQRLLECSRIENATERLNCYDEMVREESEASATIEKTAVKCKTDDREKTSYLSKRWHLDDKRGRGEYTLLPHRTNYILPLTHNNLPNKDPIEQASPGKDIQEAEVKFQISLKVNLWPKVLGKDMDLWFGYTQKSFWQLYNFDDSSPFRETNYEPELLLNIPTEFPFLGLKGRIVNIGINHQSNGRSDPLSRSWNRIVANVGLERKCFTLLVKTWYRIPEGAEDDDNPEMDDYLGYGEIWGYYMLGGQRFGVMLRNNLKPTDNRGALQLEWSFPIIGNVSGHLQYFTGYGESLLDYNHSVNRFGVGLSLSDWDF